MVTQEVPKLPSSYGHTECIATYNQFALSEIQKLTE